LNFNLGDVEINKMLIERIMRNSPLTTLTGQYASIL